MKEFGFENVVQFTLREIHRQVKSNIIYGQREIFVQEPLSVILNLSGHTEAYFEVKFTIFLTSILFYANILWKRFHILSILSLKFIFPAIVYQYSSEIAEYTNLPVRWYACSLIHVSSHNKELR
jgi:hypothetical protein